MESLDIYFLGTLVALLVIAIIDMVDKSKGYNNKYDKNEDVIVMSLLIASSWFSLVVVGLIILFSDKIKKVNS